MKRRNGFVSNSSSSSFIIGLGVVSDYEKFTKWYNKHKEKHSIHLISSKNLNSNTGHLSLQGDRLLLQAPVNSEPAVSIKKTDIEKYSHDKIEKKIKTKMMLKDEDFDIAALFIGNDEGDSSFYNHEREELDYDIELDWFDEDQRKMYLEFNEENGISCVDKMYGADRNG